jgi:cysteine desulfurase/selenocysteine lyase
MSVNFGEWDIVCYSEKKGNNLKEWICILSGFHCAQPLHDRLGIGPSARVSFYIYNTEEEIEIMTELLSKLAQFI